MLAYATRHGEPEIPTDSSDDEWRCIGPHLPGPTGWRRPRLHGLRAILVAVFYILKSGCPWRLLTRGDFPPRKTVYDWFRRWCIGWAWERLNTQLRERLQARLGRDLGTRTLAPGSWAPSERRRPASAGSKGATRGGQEGKWPQEAHALVDDTEGLCSPASNVARERHHLRSRWVDQQSRVAKEFAREETSVFLTRRKRENLETVAKGLYAKVGLTHRRLTL